MFLGIDFNLLSPMLKYSILFILAVIEGPMIMMLSGFLLKLGVLAFVPTFMALGAGDLAGDLGWYGLGYWGGTKIVKRVGRFFSVSEAMIERIEALLIKYHGRILFFSKVTMGFGFALATLISAGMARISPKSFLFYNFCGELLWLSVLLFIGHSLGQLYLSLGQGFNYLSAFAGFVLAALLLAGFTNFMRKYFTKNKF